MASGEKSLRLSATTLMQRGRAGEPGTARAAAAVADYVAGMTDRFARDEHARLTDLSVPG